MQNDAQEDLPDVRDQLLNQLVLSDPLTFIYAGQPPPTSSRQRKRSGAALLKDAGGAAATSIDETAAVFGSYAAVTLCDCR